MGKIAFAQLKDYVSSYLKCRVERKI